MSPELIGKVSPEINAGKAHGKTGEKMKLKAIFLFILLSVFVCYPSYPGESVWLDNGKPTEETENAKSKDGFGAQLWLTSDENFLEKWNKPENPKLAITKRAHRNKPVCVIILFINPSVDEKKECNIVGDILIHQPDGKVYEDIKDFKIWQNRPAPPKDYMQLAESDIGIVIEDKDPLGAYTIDVLVRDRIKNISIPLHYEFIAEE